MSERHDTYLRPTSAGRRTIQLLLCATMLAGAGATQAFAQAATQPAAKGVEIEEVVVTTRRQAEKLQEVPLAITALTATTLKQAGVQKLSDAAALTAGLLVAKTSSESGNFPVGGAGVIRGIADVSGSGNPTVGVYFNGVYLPNPSSVSVGIIGMERIEIVKGPVTALYGRGAFAGAINYVLQQPSNVLEGSITGEYGNGGKEAVSGRLSGPIVPGLLSVAVDGSYDKFDGTYTDSVNGLHAGGHDKKDGRVSFLLTPTPKMKVYGGYYYGKDSFNYPPETHLDNNCGPYNAAALTPGTQYAYYCGKVTAQHPVEVANVPSAAGQDANNRNVQIGDLHVNYDLDWADLNVIFGYNRVIQYGFLDFTTYRDGIPFALTPGPGSVNLYELFGTQNNNEDVSLEVRLASKQNQRLRWAVGGYASKEQSTSSTLIGLDRSKIPAGQSLLPSYATGLLYLTSNGQPSQSNITTTDFTDGQLSPFVSVEVDPLQNLTAFGEVRYVDQKKTVDLLRNGSFTNVLRPFGAGRTGKFYFTNYRTGLRYKFTPDIMVYGTVATGAKAGGFNSRATFAADLLYAPETNTTYETGVKAQLFDRRLMVNADVFYIQDNGLQVSAPSSDPANVGLVTKNYGDTTSKGFELEAQGVVNHMITLTGALAYADPKFSNTAYNFSPPATCTFVASCKARLVPVVVASGTKTAESLDGLQVPYTSKWIINLGANFKGEITDNLNWFGRVAYRYESKRYNSVDDFNFVDSRNNIDLSAGLTQGRLTGTVYVNNVTNDQTPLYTATNVRLNDFGNTFVSQLPDARQYGVRLTYAF